jgi:rod shape-determining protein MreC
MAASGNRRPGFSRRAQYSVFASYVIAVAGTLVGAILLALSHFDPVAFAAFRSGVAEFTAPVSSGLAWVGRTVGSAPQTITDFVTGGQTAAMRRQIADEQALLTRARSLVNENQRLKMLLKVRERIEAPVVTARLVSSTGSSTRRFATLNAGSWQNVEAGQPVRGPGGLIGQVIETGPNTARVLLLTDPESSVPVRRTRDGLAALAQGRGDGLLDVRAVSGNADFIGGELFVTSGAGGVYPPGIPVARVLRRGRDIALAQAFSRADTLDYAIVERAYLPPLPPPPAPPAPPKAAKK